MPENDYLNTSKAQYLSPDGIKTAGATIDEMKTLVADLTAKNNAAEEEKKELEAKLEANTEELKKACETIAAKDDAIKELTAKIDNVSYCIV